MQKAHDASKNNFWKNLPSVETPITKDELNRMEVSMDTIDDRVVTFDTTKANQSDLLQTIKTVSFNSTTGVFTFTLWNNTTITVDTDLEKVVTNFDYDDDPTSPHYQCLVLTLDSGEVKYIDMSALITQYEFSNTSTIAFTVGNDGTITANVIDGSITGSKLEPNYLANVTAQAQAAANSATASANSAKDSEAWAVGTRNGQAVPSTDPQYNNDSKHWAEEAAASALLAKGHQIINESGTTMTQRQKMQFYGTGVSVTDDSTNGITKVEITGGSSSGGHTIKNASGTSLTQRDVLKFKGFLKATDNNVSEETEIDDSAEEVTWATWNAMTDAERDVYSAGKRINITNVPGADGTISADMLTKLWENQNPTQAFAEQNVALSSSDYDFLLFDFSSNSLILSKGSSGSISDCLPASSHTNLRSRRRGVTYVNDTSYTIKDCEAQQQGSSQTITNDYFIPRAIYGLKKSFTFKVSAIASDVSTSASKCMLSDGVTSVEDRLDANTISSATRDTLSANVAYTAPSDGYLIVGCINNTSSKVQVAIDGSIGLLYVYGTTQGYSCNSCFIKKGMRLTVTAIEGNGWAYFYPLAQKGDPKWKT